MASVMPLSEKDLHCPVCCEVFVFPVTLECRHTICKICVQKHWEWKGSRECPVCQRRSSTDRPPINLALKIASDSLMGLKLQNAKMDSEAWCNLHNEQLKVFCLFEEKPICTVCQVSKEHRLHLCCPVEEAALDRKREISTQLNSFQKQLKAFNAIKGDWTETENYIKVQADKTDRQIRTEFEKLHKFLWEEETARLAALREEEKKKTQTVKEKLEGITNTIAVLSDTISNLQKAIEADDVSFLQDFKQTKSRAISRTPEVERISGALIDVSKHLGSLKFHVWKKMLEIINYTHITMDPNTAHPNLSFTLELSSVRYSSKHEVPDNPERCTSRMAVMGAEGFTSGRYTWDVEVGDNRDWCIGVAQESILRKKTIFLKPGEGFWTISLCNGDTYWAQTSPRTRLSLKTKPQRITVDLDYDKGKVAFIDSISTMPIYTFKHKFNEKLFPYFSPGINVEGKNQSPIKVCPLTVSVMTK
ncbi:zinc-binding protein A33-like [Anguilla rostrata]|uniref:zinc-binding protein A33-like n=1 Tax=Anguilla rostrata TaxID=7938 RepID=UPI0030D491E1